MKYSVCLTLDPYLKEWLIELAKKKDRSVAYTLREILQEARKNESCNCS